MQRSILSYELNTREKSKYIHVQIYSEIGLESTVHRPEIAPSTVSEERR